MFRLHKNRQAKSGEKVDFKFSNFKALQVPKGWDKLFVSVVSEQTGKTIVKSSKASVRNGSCQWTESLSESIWVSQDEISKEFEDCNFKLVVAMGSARSNILGEAMVNITNYTDSRFSAAVSLPLKKCNYGTILQVKIQCLTPITKVRNGDLDRTNTPKQDLKKDGHDSDSCSDRTDSQLSRSIGSSSGADLGSSLHSGEPSSKEASFSASYSQLSYDSAETSEPVENYSATNSCGDIQRQDSASSQSSVPCSSPNSVITASCNHSQNGCQDFAISSSRMSSSSKNFLEAAEGTTIEELRAEAKMWERNARKLMVDLDQLKKEFVDQSQNQGSLNTALSAATAECDSLRKELEQLKQSTERSMQRRTALEDLSHQDGEPEPHILQELKDELKFQKESNADLALQLKRSQESNIELVSVLQELEATTEKQKLEIEELLAQRVKDNDTENLVQENKTLMLQLENVKESEKNLQLKVQLLERNLEETKLDARKCGVRNHRCPLDADKEYDEEDMGSTRSVDINLVKEIDMLKEKVQELEKDCNELTDENIELLNKLKQATNNSKGGGLASGGEFLSNSFVNFEFDTIEHKYSPQNLQEEEIPSVIENNDGPSYKKLESMKFELEVKVEELSRELTEKKLEIEQLEASTLSKEDEIKILRDLHNKLQVKYFDLEKEKEQIEAQMEVILRESDVNSECLNDLRNDVKVLSNSVDLHVSANKILEEKSLGLERENRELELHISQMEHECMNLSAHMSGLESQLRYMTDEKESIRLELENSKSHAVSLQDEVDRFRLRTETGSVDLKRMMNDVQNQCAEAQDQCEYLRRENTKLEAAAELLIEERDLLQKSNLELTKKCFELHESYFHLESKLKDSYERSAQCFRRVDDFEDYISLGLEDFASKEKFLSSELDSLVEENRKYKATLDMLESFYHEKYLEKATEIQKLQEAVMHLTKQLSATQNDLNVTQMESDKKLSELINELSMSKQNQEILFADSDKLLKQLEKYKSVEFKLKSFVNDLELKLSVSEKERKQHEEELTNLKDQLQKMADLQDEVFASRNKLEATKNEREEVEAGFNLISKECEDLRTEKNSLLEKFTELQKTVTELEDSKHKGVALEEKLLKMESEAVAKDASFTQDGDLRNELREIKRVNSRYQQQLKVLEEEKDECLKRSQSLEAELKLLKEEKQIQRESSSLKVHGFSKTNGKNMPSKDMKLLKNDAVKTASQNHNGKKKPTLKNSQSHEPVKDPKDPNSNHSQSQIKDGSGCDIQDESPRTSGADSVARIQLLEKELAEALEANKNYRDQLCRLVSDNPNGKENPPQISVVEGDVVAKERYESTKSALETELRDIRERYFHISLKYAEVEHQREELVMKLKAAKNGRRWFS